MSISLQIQRAVRTGLLLLACLAPPLAAQQNAAEEAEAAERARAVALADSIRATLVQPEGSKGYSPALLVRAPFQLFGALLGVIAGIGYVGYQALDETGTLDLLNAADRDLEALGVDAGVRNLGSRSGPALFARWRGGPVFVEAGRSWRGYTLARGGLMVGDTTKGVELVAERRHMNQLHFWGIGPDSDADDKSDYAHTRRELGGMARVRLLPHVRVAAGGAWEEDVTGRGHDAAAPDLQDRFCCTLPYGSTGTDTWARVDAALDLDFTWIGGPYQLHGARLLTEWSGYRGRDGTDSRFQIGSTDLRIFLPLNDRQAFALRGLAMDTFGEEGNGIPLYYLPALGGENGLRGQTSWRLRDKALLAGMAEWRYQIWWHPGDPIYRLDGFAFVDHGAVGSSLDAIAAGDFDTSRGLGIRFVSHGIGKVEGFVALGGDNARVGFNLGASF